MAIQKYDICCQNFQPIRIRHKLDPKYQNKKQYTNAKLSIKTIIIKDM